MCKKAIKTVKQLKCEYLVQKTTSLTLSKFNAHSCIFLCFKVYFSNKNLPLPISFYINFFLFIIRAWGV